MAVVKSGAYYSKACTAGMIARMAGCPRTFVASLEAAGVITASKDPYTGFKLYSAEDGDIAKFARYCSTQLGFQRRALVFLIPFLQLLLPDYTWLEISQAMEQVARTTKIQQTTNRGNIDNDYL